MKTELLQHPIKEMLPLTDRQECLLLMGQFAQMSEMAAKCGKCSGRFRFHMTAESKQELCKLYEQIMKKLDLFGWDSPQKALNRYLTYGYEPTLPICSITFYSEMK